MIGRDRKDSKRRDRRINAARDPEGAYHQLVRGCSSKSGYPSRRVARGVKNSMLSRTHNWDEWFLVESCLMIYHCRFCGNWHLGNDWNKYSRLCNEQGYGEELSQGVRVRLQEVEC